MSATRLRAIPASLLVVVLLGTALLAGCGETREERYCAVLSKERPGLTALAERGGLQMLLKSIPALTRLKAAAPEDLVDEYQVLLNALGDLRDALAEAGLEPADLADRELPESLSKTDEERLLAAVNNLTSAQMTAASEGIESHAQDVCKVGLTL